MQSLTIPSGPGWRPGDEFGHHKYYNIIVKNPPLLQIRVYEGDSRYKGSRSNFTLCLRWIVQWGCAKGSTLCPIPWSKIRTLPSCRYGNKNGILSWNRFLKIVVMTALAMSLEDQQSNIANCCGYCTVLYSDHWSPVSQQTSYKQCKYHQTHYYF